MGDPLTFPQLVSKDRDQNAEDNPIIVRLSDGTNFVTITSNQLEVVTNIEYAVDSVAGGTDVGAAVLAVRDDVLTTLTPVDGDYVRLRTDSTGALWVNDVNAANSAVIVDDAVFTPAVSNVNMAGFFADEASPDSVDEGDGGAARMTLDRKQLVVLTDSTVDGQRITIDAGGAIQVDVTDQVPGTGATNLGKAEDNVDGLTDTGVKMLATRDDLLTTLTPAAGDYVGLKVDAIGALWVRNIAEGTSGTETHDYDEGVDIAVDTGDNHDYTVVGGTFLLKQVSWAGAGNVKVDVQTGALASLSSNTVFTGFLTGRQGDTKIKIWDPPLEVPVTGTGTVRVVRTNRQGQAQSVYSSIEGTQLP